MTRLRVTVALPPGVLPDDWLTEGEAAELVGCRRNNLNQLRAKGTGPAFTLLCDMPDSISNLHERSAMYRACDVLTWYRNRLTTR